MFPIIPNCFNKKDEKLCRFKIDEIIKNPGVFTGTFIPINSVSNGFYCCDLIDINFCDEHFIIILKNGFICMKNFELNWIKNIRIANDIYSHNAILNKRNDGKLDIRVIKDIKVGDEIILWFSDDIGVLMNISHLSPINIQGNQKL